MKYSEHTEVLTAFVSYLALTGFESRTAESMAQDLGLLRKNEGSVQAYEDKLKEVTQVLDGFPGIFRRSRRGDEKKGHYYTLHLRYALRPTDGESDHGRDERPPLPADYVVALLEMIGHRASQERTEAQARRENRLTAVGVWVAASAAILAALISASKS